MVNKIISKVLFSQFTVDMYHQLTDHALGVMCEGLPTGKTWMLEQSETCELKLFLTDTGCAHFGAFKRLFLYFASHFMSSIHVVVQHKV